jgi:hypothetical protein
LICCCLNRVSIEVLEMYNLFNRPIFSLVLCCIEILIMKIILLLIRFYYWSIPTYVAASLITLINIYIYKTFKSHCVSVCRLVKRRNQEMMGV